MKPYADDLRAYLDEHDNLSALERAWFVMLANDLEQIEELGVQPAAPPAPACEPRDTGLTYGGVPIYETTDPAFAGKGLVAVNAPPRDAAKGGVTIDGDPDTLISVSAAPPRADAMTVDELCEAVNGELSLIDGISVADHHAAMTKIRARLARTFRAPAVSEAMRWAINLWDADGWMHGESNKLGDNAGWVEQKRKMAAQAVRDLAALDSGASVVVDRAEWERITSERSSALDGLRAKLAAAERADEGLEEEAERLREAYTNDEGSWLEWPDCRQEPWLRVARVARALRRGGVTADLLREANDLYGKFDLASEHGSKLRLDLSERIEAHLAALDSGASVVVDREEWERTKADLERLRAFYRSVNDEIPEGLWPAATTLDAFRKLVDGYANVCADAKALHEREEERDRALADTEHRHALAERERDQLAAKLAEAERSRDDAKTLLEGAMHGQAMAEEDVRNARAEAERLREANTKLLMGTAPPTVAVTNHALAASKIVAALLPRAGDLDAAMARGQTEAILRACTRAASVEEVRKAILHAFAHPSDPNDGDAMTAAKAALRALGVREAEKNTEGGAPIRKDGGCGESPATFSPPSVPPPAPAQAGWTEVAAESIVKMLRPHDGESRHRLNVEEVLDILRARAPKVRVRLPALRSYEANGESTAWKAGYNDARMECAAALRAAGVLIEGEQ